MSTNTFSVTRTVSRNKIVKKVGLDSSIFVALVDDEQQYSRFTPKIFVRNNFVYVSDIVFSETLNVLIGKRGYTEAEALDKIFGYMRSHKISMVKSKVVGYDKVKLLVDELKEQRKKIKEHPEDSDLKIMALYKLGGIDCIFVVNDRHFRELCTYLNIDVEKPIDNVNTQMRRIFGWYRSNRYKGNRKKRNRR